MDWCNSKLGKDYKNLNFKYVSVYNDLYNSSELDAKEFVFPYPSGYFNEIFSFSVFTHMQIEEIQNYFKEIERVSKPDAINFSTFFLYDNEDEEYIANKKDFAFPFKKEGYRLMDENVKSGNIAIHKDKIKLMLKEANLKPIKIIDGFWKAKHIDKKEFQDIIVFKRL